MKAIGAGGRAAGSMRGRSSAASAQDGKAARRVRSVDALARRSAPWSTQRRSWRARACATASAAQSELGCAGRREAGARFLRTRRRSVRARRGVADRACACARRARRSRNGLADVREAVDFLRYYAGLARADFAAPKVLPGPTGERNELSLHGRGVFAASVRGIFRSRFSPARSRARWRRATAVVAKPAEQTPLTAFAATRLAA